MGLALDEPSDQDAVQKEDGFDLVMEKALLNQLGGVSIDFVTYQWLGGKGFSVIPKHQAASSCC